MPAGFTALLLRSMLLAGPFACLIACLSGCDRRQPTGANSARPVLAVSVFPVADLAGRVAGDRWQIVTLLPAGYSPHEYSMRPATAAGLQTAKVLIAVGPGLDDWAIRAGWAASGQREVLVLTEALGLGADTPADHPATRERGGTPANGVGVAPGRDVAPDDDHADAARPADHEPHDHHAHGDDPHIWLDPILTERVVDQIAGVLSRHDPAGQAIYQQNAAALKKDLAALDAEYRTTLAACRTKTLVVFHAGYGYLARRYGLQQVALLGLGGVTPGRLEQIVQRIEQEHIRAVYREPQYESKWVDTLGRRTGAAVLVLDPLGHADRPGYDSYFAMMRSNLAALKEGLNHGP